MFKSWRRRWRWVRMRHRRAGDTARDRGDLLVAAREYRRHLARHPSDASIWVQLGHVLGRRGELEAATDAYERALAREPDDGEVLLHLAHLLKRQRRWSEALACFDRRIDMDSDVEAMREAYLLREGQLSDGSWDSAALPAADVSPAVLAHLASLTTNLEVIGARGLRLAPDGSFEIEGRDASIDLVCTAPLVSTSLVALTFEISGADGSDRTIGRLLVDYGSGFAHRAAIPMRVSPATSLVAFPGVARRMRWFLPARCGPLRLAAVVVEPIAPGRLPPADDASDASALALRLMCDRQALPIAEPTARAMQHRIATHYGGVFDHERWLADYQDPTAGEKALIRALVTDLGIPPTFSFVLPVYEAPPEFLRRCLASLAGQLYPCFEICIADDASSDGTVRQILADFAESNSHVKLAFRAVNGHISAASNTALALATGEFVVLVDQDDEIPSYALATIALAIREHPAASVFFSDEDKIEPDGYRHSPYFKGSYDPYLMYGHNMVSHLGVYRRSLVTEVGGFREGMEGSQDYDLFLRCYDTVGQGGVVHVPHILYHWRAAEGSTALAPEHKGYALVAANAALNAHFARARLPLRSTAGFAPGVTGVSPLGPVNPARVSIIIPTRDKLGLLEPCIASICKQQRTPDPALDPEIIVIDNGSSDAATLAFLNQQAAEGVINLLRRDEPFNFSRLNNDAARHAKGDILCFLNNDTEVIAPDWLNRARFLLALPDIGIVGARLLNSDRTVQQVGLGLGMMAHRVAGALHNGLEEEEPGYFGKAKLLQQVGAVTAACMFVRRDRFLALGGFDAGLPVAYNDVDLCLRYRQAGLRVVVDPAIELIHKESQTRLRDLNGPRLERLERDARIVRQRWGSALDEDPFLSPNLALDDSLLSPARPPRRLVPWKQPLAADHAEATARH